MKTPKEKAEEIWLCYYELIDDIYSNEAAKELAKKYSLIAVNEIFEHIDYIFTELEKDNLPNKFDDEIEYWQEVKKEIELL
jgi:hypothetical protein